MNYRQWKKNFKKTYGRNPNAIEDKRQRAKAAKYVLNNIDLDALKQNVINMANEIAPAIYKAAAAICSSLSETLNNASKNFRDLADSYEESEGGDNELSSN